MEKYHSLEQEKVEVDEENQYLSSEGEESTDSEAAREVAFGFIVNDEEVGEGIKEKSKKKKKKSKKKSKKRPHESSDDLSEDELDLIEENTGVKIACREQKFKRLKKGVRKPSNDVKNIFDEDEEEVLKDNEVNFYDDDDFIEGERYEPTIFEDVFHDLEEKYTFASEKIEVPDFNIETLEKIFSPESYLTRKDKAIKVTDLPERFQVRSDIVVNRKLTKEEIDLATDVITKSVADYRGIPISSQLSKAVENALICFSREFIEVPCIWTYKRDLITSEPMTPALSREDLWHIFDLEYEFRKLVEMRDQLNSEISKNDFQDSYVKKVLSEAKNINELYDLKKYINFQDKKKTISVQQESPRDEYRRKGVLSNNVKYLEYIHNGLLRIVDKFGVQIPLFVQNLLGTKNYQPLNEELTPIEVAQKFYPGSKAPDELLKQSMELLAYEFSVDPIFIKIVRDNYMEHGLLVTSGPLEVITSNDECWRYCFWKVQIQKLLNIGGDFIQILHYKNQNLINISFKLHDEEGFLNILKNNIVSDDNSRPTSNSWNKYRIDALLKAYNDILKPNIESWLIAKLKVNAEQWIMEKCMLSLEKKIDVKPYRTSEMCGDAIPRVFALSFGAGRSESATCCVYINEEGKKTQEWSWSTIKYTDSKEGKEFLNALNEFGPHVVVVRCYDYKTQYLFQYVKKIVEHHNENRFEKAIVVIANDEVAMEYTLEIGKNEYPKSSEISRYCTSLARMAQNPLMEYLRLGDSIMSVKFHPLQSFLSEEKFREALDRAFINVVNEAGVDINDVLYNEHHKPKQRALHYICGFGPRKSIHLKQLIFPEEYDPKFIPFIDSRSKLKDYLEPKVFENSAGFLRICSLESLDNSRVHPYFYDLARKYSRSTPDMEDACSDQQYFLMRLISKENREPFYDMRQDYEMPTSDQIFEMITKETKSSLYPGLIIQVVVKSISTNALKVRLKNGFECNIGWHYMDKNSYVKKGDTLNALVKSINKEDFTIVLSCRQMDLEKGQHRTFHNKVFDEFIDREAKRNYRPPVKAEKVSQPKYNTPQPPRPLRIITHPCFERVSPQEAEKKLSMQPNGSYIIRPTTVDPYKLSITWKVYDKIYRHFHIVEKGLEPGFEVGRRLFVENEPKEYEALDELLVTYIQDTSYFIEGLINHQKFKATEEELNELLETSLRNVPQNTAYGFCMDNAYPCGFICGYKFRSQTRMFKLRGMFRPYGFRVEESRFSDINELINGIKDIILVRHTKSTAH